LFDNIIPDYHIGKPLLLGLLIDQKVLEELLKDYSPELHKKLTSITSLPIITTQWFMNLLVNILPSESTLLIWDNLFAQGSYIILLAALGFLCLHSEELLSPTDVAELCIKVKTLGKGQFDKQKLLTSIIELAEKVSESKIENMRDKHREIIMKEYLDAKRKAYINEVQSTTEFTKKELDDLYVCFQKYCETTDAENTIDFGQFEKVINEVLPNWKHHSSTSLQNMFKAFDLEKDAKISFRELMIGLSIVYKGTLDEKLQFCFRVYDIRNEGILHKEELQFMFETIFRTLYHESSTSSSRIEEEARLAFTTLDMNNKGYITFEEFKEIVLVEPLISEFFSSQEANSVSPVSDFMKDLPKDISKEEDVIVNVVEEKDLLLPRKKKHSRVCKCNIQ